MLRGPNDAVSRIDTSGSGMSAAIGYRRLDRPYIDLAKCSLFVEMEEMERAERLPSDENCVKLFPHLIQRVSAP